MALAQSPEASKIKPYRDVSGPSSDSRSVYMFVDFACPVCAQLHESSTNWAVSLPKEWRVQYVPVITKDRGSVVAARAFYTVQELAPRRLAQYMGAVYRSVRGDRAKLQDPAVWSQAAKEVGVQGFEAAWQRTSKDAAELALERLMTYQIAVTPSFAIAGQFVITPDDTNGDMSLFIKLASGLVSKSMY